MPNRGNLIRRSQHTRSILLVGVPPVLELDLFGPASAFDLVNKLVAGSPLAPANEPPYRLTIISSTENCQLEGEAGCRLAAHSSYKDYEEEVDTLLVTAGPRSIDDVGAPEFREWLRRMSKRARRTASVCIGAFILADAGLLEGKRAATHWHWVNELQMRHPNVLVDPESIWVKDQGIYTSAGGTAGIDLALAMVTEDYGNAVALNVARNLVVFLKRPGGQRQYSVSLAAQAPKSPTFEDLGVWIVENLDKPLSVESLAQRMAMSPRNFARVFRAEFGCTPASYVRQSRVEAARGLLQESGHGLEKIAAHCGFGSDEAMRKAFIDVLGVSPGHYRTTFQTHH